MGIRNRKSARIVGMVVVPIALTTFYTNLAIFSQFQRNITLMIRMEQPRQSATKVSHIDGYGNVVTEEKGDSVKNTNWDNVQYSE